MTRELASVVASDASTVRKVAECGQDNNNAVVMCIFMVHLEIDLRGGGKISNFEIKGGQKLYLCRAGGFWGYAPPGSLIVF